MELDLTKKKTIPVKCDFKNNWISLFERQGWKYKVLEDGRVMTIISLLSSKVTLFIEDDRMQMCFWVRRIGTGITTNGYMSLKRYRFSIKKGKIYLTVGNQVGNNFKDKTLYNLPMLFQSLDKLFANTKRGNGPEWIKDPEWTGMKQRNIVRISSPKNKRKLDIIFNTFFGLNKIPYNFCFIKNQLDFVPFIWNNKYPTLKNLQKDASFYVRNPYLKEHLLKKNLTDKKLMKYFFGSSGKKIKKLYYMIEDIQFPFYIFRYLSKRLNRGQIENILEHASLSGPFSNSRNHFRTNTDIRLKLLDDYSSLRIYNLFKEFTNRDLGNMIDTLEQLGSRRQDMILPEAPKNFKELHDDISVQYRKLQHANYEFDVPKILTEIDGIEVNILDKKYNIVVPKERYELIEWGTKMSNCIASYHQSFHRGDVQILGVKGQDIEINISIQGKRIQQFYAKGNRTPDKAFYEPVLNALVDHNIVSESELERYVG